MKDKRLVKLAKLLESNALSDADKAVYKNEFQQILDAMAQEENSSDKSESSTPGFSAIFLGKSRVAPPSIKPLYRGDLTSSKKVFRKGFKARGTNMDFLEHAAKNSPKSSGYVSLSTDKNVAVEFPKFPSQNTKVGFLYEINPQKKGIDVGKALLPEVGKGRLNIEDYKALSGEKEIAIPSKIKPQDVKGAWRVEIKDIGTLDDLWDYSRIRTVGKYIPNPNYVPPKSNAQKTWGAVKGTTVGLTTVGVILDGVRLYQSFEHSKQINNYDPFFRESSRIIGGWSAAYALGISFAKIGAAACSPIPPYGAPVCGALGGIAGSIIGYWKGGDLAVSTYDSQKRSAKTPLNNPQHIHQQKQNHPTSLIQNSPTSNAITSSKTQQQAKCQATTLRRHIHDRALNSFAPGVNIMSTLRSINSLKSFLVTPIGFVNNPRRSPSVNLFLNTHRYGQEWQVKNIVKNAVKSELHSIFPSAMLAYSKAYTALGGYGYILSLSEFRSVAASTNLIDSYNAVHRFSKLKDVEKFCRDIGGVVSEVATITDLIDSEAHAEAQEYILCFPTEYFPNSFALVKQVARELARAFEKGASPFYSQQFNNKHVLYPLIHPAYQNTLIGQMIGFLDYWMKGFLNGGAFDREFLKIWHTTQNCDENYLRSHMIDLKKYCQKYAKEVNYSSLPELESRYGLANKNDAIPCAYGQPFMVAFRIISYQEKMERYNNILIPYPTYRIEYTIDPRPDYKNYIETYRKEHGEYPLEYYRIHYLYQQYSEEMKEKLLQLPFLQEFLRLLGVTNAFGYMNETLDQMGKMAYFETPEVEATSPFPKALPPYPVRHYRTYPMEITFEQVIRSLLTTEEEKQTIDAIVFTLLSEKRIRTLPENLGQKIQQAILKLVKENLTTLISANELEDIHEEEIDAIFQESSHFLLQQIYQTYTAMHYSLNKWAMRLGDEEGKQIKNLNLPTKIMQLQAELNRQFEATTARWHASPNEAKVEIFNKVPEVLHDIIRDNFRKIEDDHQKDLESVTTKIVELNVTEMEATINAQLTAKIQEAHGVITKLQNNKQILENNINQGLQSIAALEQDKKRKLRQMAHVPGFNTKAFITQVDQVVNEINEGINTVQKDIVLINQNITNKYVAIANLQNQAATLIENGKKEISDNVQLQVVPVLKEKAAQQIVEDYKEEAIRILTLQHSRDTEKLVLLKTQIEHFTSTLLDIPGVAAHTVAKQYSHSCIEFPGKIVDGKCITTKINGGCSVELPNIKSEPILNAKSFSEALAKAVPEKGEEIGKFEFNGQAYVAFRLPVVDVVDQLQQKQDCEPTLQDQAFSILDDLAEQDISPDALSENLKQIKIDDSGATLLHYGAAALGEIPFAKLLPVLSNQLNVPDQFGHLSIHAACQTGNVAVVAQLIAHDPSQRDAKNHRDVTPLQLAVQYGQEAAVAKLLELGADANFYMPNGLSPLYVAIQNNFPDIALLLIEKVTNQGISESLDDGMTPLHLACERKLTTVATRLIEKGATLDAKRNVDGYMPLHCAAEQGQIELIKTMAARGFSLHLALETQKTALHIAAEAGHLELVHYLLAQGLDINAKTGDGDTPIMLAIKAGENKVAHALASLAGINIVNNRNETASLIAQQYHMPTVADMFIQRNENPLLCDKERHNYFYYLACHGDYRRFFNLVENHAVDLHQTFADESLLAIAAKHGHFPLVYELINRKAPYATLSGLDVIHYAVMADEIEFLNDWLKHHTIDEAKILSGQYCGKSLAYLATEQGSERCLSTLLQTLSVSDREPSQSLLYEAICHQKVSTTEVLLKYVKNINEAIDDKGNTALHHAVHSGSREIVELLIKRGCDAQLRNLRGQTPFHIALTQEDTYLLKRLFKLTKPSEWPNDLWGSTNKKLSREISTVLKKYQKRLPQLIDHKEEKFIPPAPLNAPVEELKELKTEDIQEFELCLKAAAFDEAADLLEQKPILLRAFKFPVGGKLFQSIIKNVRNYSPEINKLLFPSIDRLLKILKNAGVNLSHFTGKNNTLFTIIQSKSDEEASYRLDLLCQHFPECLPVLARDHYSPDLRIMSLALNSNKPMLFKKLKELYAKNSTDDHPFYALHEAVMANRSDIVNDQLQDHSVNLQNDQKATPLMLAAAQGNLHIIELLLQHGASVYQTDIYGRNALHYAILSKSVPAALRLLPLLYKPNQPDRNGKTPLSLAARQGMLPVVRFLCDDANYTQDVDAMGRNALHYAAIHGQVKVIDYLISHGFQIDIPEAPKKPSKIKQCAKRTALHLAACFGHVEAVCQLLSLGADPNLKDTRGNTLCEYAVLNQDNEMLDIIQQFIAYHEKDHHTRLLHAATTANNVPAINALIAEHTIDFNAVDQNGCTALHLAAINNAGAVADILVQNEEVIPDLTNTWGDTALHSAAEYGHVRMIEILMRAGATIDKKNRDQKTPLLIACEKGHLGAIVALLKYEADVSICDANGKDPEQVALQNGHTDIAARLNQIDKIASVTHQAPEGKIEPVNALEIEKSEDINKIEKASLTELPIENLEKINLIESLLALAKQIENNVPQFVSVEEKINSTNEQLASATKDEDGKKIEDALLESAASGDLQMIDESLNSDKNTPIINEEQLSLLKKELDYFGYRSKSLDFLKKCNEPLFAQWQLFCQQLDLLSINKSQKFMLLQTAFHCLNQPVLQGELEQLIKAAVNLQSAHGTKLFLLLFNFTVSKEKQRICDYIMVCQLLVELQENPQLHRVVQETLPDFKSLLKQLHVMQDKYLKIKYPERNIDVVIERFGRKDTSVQFPLSATELNQLRSEYLLVKEQIKKIKTLPLSALKENAIKCGLDWCQNGNKAAKYELVALIAETIRRIYKISPYDTQIISLLALINTPEKLKGRIAQIKTGEGKSTIIAMLAAFMGLQGNFIDVVTSSDYLAMRDAEKYKPFFAVLGLSVSHICDKEPQQSHFHAQILYGTNTDFEFAMLRDGLSHAELRYSLRNGKLEQRSYDVVITDEADNLFLDTALNSALMSIPSPEDFTWIYPAIFAFVKKPENQKRSISKEMVSELRQALLMLKDGKFCNQVDALSDKRLKKWIHSAQVALNIKIERRDYLVKSVCEKTAQGFYEESNQIVIVDYAHTGRLNEGCQWKDGIHQCLQAKHQEKYNVKITPESLTGASVAHPTYFSLYRHIMGLTGTVGEAIEREEIQRIYNIDTFDVPPHFNSLRTELPPYIAETRAQQYKEILNKIKETQQSGRPILVLFKTILESENFSQLLHTQGIYHQLINENQRASEDYLVACAGEQSMCTIATNTAGRGTDILLREMSKKMGGLTVILAFYPDNLRVKLQGDGRAARQGDPGTCCMILNSQDETIQKLLSWANTAPSKEIHALGRKIILLLNLRKVSEKIIPIVFIQSGDQGSIPAELIIPLLDQLRAQHIREESERRYQCAQQEAIYFGKLQVFFEQMNALYQTFENPDFKEKLLGLCRSEGIGDGDPSEMQVILYQEGSQWSQAYQMAKLLLEKQISGITVDWSSFFDQFKNAYLENARLQWAMFYNKLHNDIGYGHIDITKQQIEKMYTDAKVQLDQYLSNPNENITTIFMGILNLSYREISDQFLDEPLFFQPDDQMILKEVDLEPTPLAKLLVLHQDNKFPKIYAHAFFGGASANLWQKLPIKDQRSLASTSRSATQFFAALRELPEEKTTSEELCNNKIVPSQ